MFLVMAMAGCCASSALRSLIQTEEDQREAANLIIVRDLHLCSDLRRKTQALFELGVTKCLILRLFASLKVTDDLEILQTICLFAFLFLRYYFSIIFPIFKFFLLAKCFHN